ncbi:MAG: DNA-3-methyladenine glycosylase 2 family protein [Myxococcales bacterium]|nr:MAG: DNA-3-methyladenine glycosylase 2 family protein [Myxococcales bacterium]
MSLDAAHCYEVVKARDPRYDGVFFVGVSTTGVYCRPVCKVRTPGRDRCSYFPNAASAEAAGYRPCLRCRPELAPGGAPVDAVSRLAGAAVARIEAGALGQGSVEDLAAELGVSSRQLHRVVEAEYGVSPLALAQTRRLLLAKQLLTDTSLRVIDVAFASGFNSVRQFNRLFREQYRLSPLSLRRDKQAKTADQPILLKLGYRAPLAWQPLVHFLAGRSGVGTEKVSGDAYLRTVRLGPHRGFIVAEPLAPGLLGVRVAPSLLPVLPELRVRLRRLFDLDANPTVIDPFLRRHPELRPRVRLLQGLRVPGAFNGFELALRAVLGQQVTVKAATTIYGRFVQVFGGEVETPDPEVSRLAPDASELANASLQQIIDRGLTRRRAETVAALARAAADGALQLDPPVDFAAARAALQELPGIGPWTAEYVAMRALGDPDAFPHSDLGLLNALSLDKPAKLLALAEGWRPFRAYAALHLWHGYSSGG